MNKKNSKKTSAPSLRFALTEQNVLETLATATKNAGLTLFGTPAENVTVSGSKLHFELPAVHNDGKRKFEVSVTRL